MKNNNEKATSTGKAITLLQSGEKITLNEGLVVFVNEYTGEVDPNRRVLDKRVREAWFRSVYPDARIEASVEVSSCLDRMVKAGLNLSALPLDEAVLNKLAALDNGGRQCLATVRIYDGDKVIAEEHSLRVRYAVSDAKPFEYYTEAAINSALNRALIDLGFVIAEEYVSSSQPTVKPAEETTEGPTEAQKVIAAATEEDFNNIFDESEPEQSEKEQKKPEFAYDKKTPVEEILPNMTAEEARRYVIGGRGAYAGRTVGELFAENPDRAKWFASGKYSGDNILVAACTILINQKGGSR